MTIAVHWFRNGLRFHDNPALIEAINAAKKLITIYIFDEKTFNVKKIGYNPMRFLLESLKDLNDNLTWHGGQLYILQGNPIDIFKRIKEKIGLDVITFEQDCEHNGKIRDDLVMQFCDENNIKCIEKVSHTLWNPDEIIKKNGGTPPLTFKKFHQLTNEIGYPPKPVYNVDWLCVTFGELPISILEEFSHLKNPSPETFNIYPEVPEILKSKYRWYGGESRALQQLKDRLNFEKESFVSGFYIPNQISPDLLAPPSSLSAALRYGCLSIRKLFWELSKLFMNEFGGDLLPQYSATSQLIWRDYFYTMSINNDKFDQVEKNPACIPIAWSDMRNTESKMMLERWKNGTTGYPFIDAGMRQLMQEGWIHHVVRNSVACFLTRGDLWISWTEGLNHFLKYLIDADYSVCSGNWIWVSSSTFEQLLDCPLCICPVRYGSRLDPSGEYIRRYVPELNKIPEEYLYEPWKCPESIQKRVGCIIGKDYPNRIVDHTIVSRENRKFPENEPLLRRIQHDRWVGQFNMTEQTYKKRIKYDIICGDRGENGYKMVALRLSMTNESKILHCRPSDQAEVQQFMHLPEECIRNLYSSTENDYECINFH